MICADVVHDMCFRRICPESSLHKICADVIHDLRLSILKLHIMICVDVVRHVSTSYMICVNVCDPCVSVRGYPVPEALLVRGPDDRDRREAVQLPHPL